MDILLHDNSVLANELDFVAPSFMFLGCTDNRLTPASIFQSPIGSILTQNNIGNQYSNKDASTYVVFYAEQKTVR